VSPRPLFLIAAASLAPLFWMGQVLLSYWVTAQGCYPGDAPEPGMAVSGIQAAVWSFDAVALVAALAGGIMSLMVWRRIGRAGAHPAVVAMGEGRTRFLAIWGLYSSLWFFFAILFNAIATVTVPPCAH
jgi:hypothetical protein